MTIFISRELKSNSPFLALLADKAKVIGSSLIDFKAVPIARIPQADWLFFYSKKGIRYFFEQLPKGFSLPSLAVIGKASADYLYKNYQLQADFIGTGHPEATAQQFLSLAQQKKVVFVQAKQSRQSVQQLIKTQVETEALIVYDNVPKTTFELPVADILVFTSPMNAQAYFAQYPLKDHQQVVSIGHSTAKALKILNIHNFHIAEQPNEAALAQTCLTLLSNRSN